MNSLVKGWGLECAALAGDLKEKLVSKYYRATSIIPRKLPQTYAEYKQLKHTLVTYYGLDDSPQTWYLVGSLVQGVDRTSLRIPYRSLVNPVRRLNTNALAQEEKVIANQQNELRLKELTKKVVDDFSREEAGKLQGGAFDPSEQVPPLPEA